MLHLRILLLGTVIALAAASCAASREAVPSVAPDEAFSLAVADSVWLKDGDTSFWISLREVADSRCPKDVNCITGGKATVVAAVEAQPEAFTFCTGSDCAGEQSNNFSVEYNNSRYNIVLEDVSPYPASAGRSLETKKAIFKIKRATR